MSEYKKLLEEIMANFDKKTKTSPSLKKQQKAIEKIEEMYDDLVSKGVIEKPSYKLSSANTLPLGVPSISD